MLKKSVTYEGLDGEPVTEEFLFHLSKADFIEIELSSPGGMEEHFRRILESKNQLEIFHEFKKLLLMAYGKRSEDGKRFIKNDHIRSEIEGSEAFSELIVGLMMDEEEAARFFAGIVPKNLETSEGRFEQAKDLSEKMRMQEEAKRVDVGPQPVEPQFPRRDAEPDPGDISARMERAGYSEKDIEAQVDPNYPRPVAELSDEPERKVLTPLEIEEMDGDELKSGLATGKYIIGG